MQFEVLVANESHYPFASIICTMMEDAAKIRGTGIAKREPVYVQKKMAQGDAIIAMDGDFVVGFCYIESWDGKRYVANSGLIVHPEYRKTGLARAIKKETFQLSKRKYPEARLFGITTSLAVMKINSDLGYKPVTFSELTQDEAFWKGCQTCVNFDILTRTNRTMCLCTGMVCDLSKVPESNGEVKKTRSWQQFKDFLIDRKTRMQPLLEKIPLFKQVVRNEK